MRRPRPLLVACLLALAILWVSACERFGTNVEQQPAKPGPWMLDSPALEADDPNVKRSARTLRIGVLHSLSGDNGALGTVLKDMALMTVEQLNQGGGVLGRRVEAVVMDPASDPGLFAAQARELLEIQKVAVIFGGETTRTRRSMLTALRRFNGLLFFPVQYAGGESDYSIFYTGAVPNQWALPALEYLLSGAVGRLRSFVLIGTDSYYARGLNGIVGAYLRHRGVLPQNVLEYYVPPGHGEFQEVVTQLKLTDDAQPTGVITTLAGESNASFFTEFLQQGVTASELPVLALTLGEQQLQQLDPVLLSGHVLARNYVASIEHEANRAIQARWAEYNDKRNVADDHPARRINEAMEATYMGIQLWAQAVEQAGTAEVDAVRQALPGQSMVAPSGAEVALDLKNHHLSKPAFVAQVRDTGQVAVLWESPQAIPAEPFSRHVPEQANRVADWTFPWLCGGCVEPQYSRGRRSLALGEEVRPVTDERGTELQQPVSAVDVPVGGPGTLEPAVESGAGQLAVDAGAGPMPSAAQLDRGDEGRPDALSTAALSPAGSASGNADAVQEPPEDDYEVEEDEDGPLTDPSQQEPPAPPPPPPEALQWMDRRPADSPVNTL